MIVCLFRKNRSQILPWLAVSILYLIGLFGDSWYGITADVPLLKNLYSCMFQWFSYTRNGLFMAPLFLYMGMQMQIQKRTVKTGPCIVLLLISLACMTAEAFITHQSSSLHFDAMYLFLPPVMFFLFCLLLKIKGMESSRLRYACSIAWIIHPYMIVAIRMLAMITGQTALFVDQHLILYSCTLSLTALFSVWAVQALDSKELNVNERTDRTCVDRT